jgi:hypothetical protein
VPKALTMFVICQIQDCPCSEYRARGITVVSGSQQAEIQDISFIS